MADPRFFDNQGPFTLRQIADHAACELVEDDGADTAISDVAPLDIAAEGHLAFLDNVKYKKTFETTKATACIIRPEMVGHAPKGLCCLISDKPYKSYALAAQLFYPLRNNAELSDISPSAIIDDTATIGKGCIIEAGVVIGRGVTIGDYCWIGANVTITHAVIGDYVRIHTGVRIGQDGFGFALDPTGYEPVPQLGRVIIGDHVNIGANTCIDRGAGPDTVIGQGSIIDNLVQIGHNVRIGKGCVIVSQVGISGSTEIGDYTILGGQVGIAGHLKIGRGVQVAAQSGVTKDVKNGEKIVGFPARPMGEYWREMAKLKKLLSK